MAADVPGRGPVPQRKAASTVAAGPPATPGLLSRRDFVAGSAALVVGSSLALAGCSSGAPGASATSPAGPPRWVAVSTEGLRVAEPRWVEFDVPPGVDPATSARAPATPSGTPADALPGSRGAAWLVLQPDASVVAFAPKCTHRLCLYDWDAGTREFRCRCHPGLFGIDGKVLGGPPPRPLERLETRPAGAGVLQIGWVEQA